MIPKASVVTHAKAAAMSDYKLPLTQQEWDSLKPEHRATFTNLVAGKDPYLSAFVNGRWVGVKLR